MPRPPKPKYKNREKVLVLRDYFSIGTKLKFPYIGIIKNFSYDWDTDHYEKEYAVTIYDKKSTETAGVALVWEEDITPLTKATEILYGKG